MKNLRFFFILFALFIILINCSPEVISDEVDNSQQEEVDKLYKEYDQQFISFLNNATESLGKEIIKLENLSDVYTTPKKLSIKGTPYEIGYTIGHIANQYNTPPKRISENNHSLNQEIIAMYQKIYPQYLDIIRGIGFNFDMNLDEIDLTYMEYDFFIDLWCYLLPYRKFNQLTSFGNSNHNSNNNCSIASYFNGTQHYIGRNFDNPSDRPHYFTNSHMEGSNWMMGHSIYMLYHLVVDGINEKGLSINCATNTEEYFWQEPYPGEPSVYSGHMARIVMDTCSTVDEAIKKIGSVRVWFPNEGLHWIISDATGKSVIVEFDLDRKMVVIDKSENYELLTNTAVQKGEDYLMNTCFRYRAAKPLLEQGVDSMDDMLNVMNSMRVSAGSSRTLWTSIMNLNTRSFEIYYYKEYQNKYNFSF